MAQNLPRESAERAAFEAANPTSLSQIAKQFIQEDPYVRPDTDNSASGRLLRFIQSKSPAINGLVGRYFGSGEEVLGDNPFGPGDLSIVPTLKNIGKFITMMQEAGSIPGTGLAGEMLSSADQGYRYLKARAPRAMKKVKIEEGPTNQLGGKGIYFGVDDLKEIAEEIKMDPSANDFYHFKEGVVPTEPFARTSDLLFNPAESVQNIAHEARHYYQPERGEAFTRAEREAFNPGRLSPAEYRTLPWEIEPYRVGATAKKGFEKFKDLLDEAPIEQYQRYYNMLFKEPQWYDEAGNFIEQTPEQIANLRSLRQDSYEVVKRLEEGKKKLAAIDAAQEARRKLLEPKEK